MEDELGEERKNQRRGKGKNRELGLAEGFI
jgi:hypothetical protein